MLGAATCPVVVLKRKEVLCEDGCRPLTSGYLHSLKYSYGAASGGPPSVIF
jgi:hypothetical protein